MHGGLFANAWIVRIVRAVAERPRVYVPLLTLVALAQGALDGWAGVPADYYAFAAAGRQLFAGHLAHVFADPWMQSGPWQLVMVGSFSLLDRLSSNLGVLALTAGVTAVWVAVMPMLARVVRRAMCCGRSPLLELGVPVVALLLGVSSGLTNSGHPAEVVIPLLWVASGLALQNHKPLLAGVLLGLTTGWEPWGVLGAPLLLLAWSYRSFFRAAIAAAGVTVATYVPFIVTGHFAMFGFHWQVAPYTLDHWMWPHLTAFTWPMRLLQGLAALGAGCVLAVLARKSPGRVWLVAFGIVVARLILDPLMAPYYWLALQALLLVGLLAIDWRRPMHVAVMVVLCYLQTFQSPNVVRFTLIPAAVGVVVLSWGRVRPVSRLRPIAGLNGRYEDRAVVAVITDMDEYLLRQVGRDDANAADRGTGLFTGWRGEVAAAQQGGRDLAGR